jgi:hypothetical protein
VIWCDDVVLATIEIGLRSVVDFSAILWRCSTTVWSISLSEIEQASTPTLHYPLARGLDVLCMSLAFDGLID